ncbi:MAG: ABC transporter ATP-binding protein [Phycisphaerales bacterium]|nr:ABC transporter ATP-binding protein [Phycisphaerales bacterium]
MGHTSLAKEAIRLSGGLQTAPTTAPWPLLMARNVHRFLGSGEGLTHILKGVNLTVTRGEYVAIIGASGSGKSTLLYLLGGLDRPSTTDGAGQPIEPSPAVLIEGQNTADLNDLELARLRNQKIGFVFQFHYLLKEFTAQENVCLPMLKLGRLTRSDAMERAAQLLARLGLAQKIRRRANRLSGGEQQRVAIARALANEPDVLLADEPTGNLDRRNGELVADILSELAAGGQTLVIVTHEMPLAHRARRIVRMDDGMIAEDQPTDPTAPAGYSRACQANS